MPLIRLAELEIALEALDAYCALLAEEIAASVALEPGVLSLSAVALRDRPAAIRLLEVYADRAAYESHLTSPHFPLYEAATAAMVLSLRLLDADSILLAPKPPG